MSTQTLATPQITLPPPLPSAQSALALVNGQPGALPLVVLHTGLRAGIIATGLWVANMLEPNPYLRRGRILGTAVVSSLAIEAFVLGWAAWQKGRTA